MDIADDLHDKLESIVEEVAKAMEPPPGQTLSEQRQFVVGYVNLLADASKGYTAARDEYLATVIPGVKQSGMPLEFVLGGMIITAMSVAAHVAPEHRNWHIMFARDYVERLARAWAAA